MSDATDRSGEGRRRRGAGPEGGIQAEIDAVDEVVAPGTTGRWLVLFGEDEAAVLAGTRALSEAAGLQVASAADFDGGAVTPEALAGAEALVFPELGVAVTSAPPAQLRQLGARAAEETGILAMEPERVVYALGGDDPAAQRPLPRTPYRLPRRPVIALPWTTCGRSRRGSTPRSSTRWRRRACPAGWRHRAV